MDLRKARAEDAAEILMLFDHARAFLRAQGVNQWQNSNYPNLEDIEADLALEQSYVLEDGGRPVATAVLSFEHEPTYDIIRDGAWDSPEDSAVIHRVATAPAARGSGVATALLQGLEALCVARGAGGIRVDTHAENKPMQRLLQKCGFVRRGIVLMEDGVSERVAFDKRL